MRQFWVFLIVAGGTLTLFGCRTDNSATTVPQMDQGSGTPVRSADAANGTDQPKVAARESPVDGRPLVVCFGDSLTAGYGADEGDSYPDFLQKDLDAAGYHYRVVNEGISGNTTKDGVDRLAEIEQMRPAVVILEFGGNDGLRGFNVQTTRANLAKMIDGLQHAGSKVIVAGITLPPDYGADYVSAFTANYSALGQKFGAPVLPFLLKGVYGVPGMMQGDNIHATDRGNEIVARNLLPLVRPLLKK